MPKGYPKAGGRTKGTPNRKTLELIGICEAKGVSPFEALLDLCQHDDVSVRLAALKEVCQYLYPKRKAIEMDLKMIEKQLEPMSEAELIKLAEEKIKQLKGN